MSDPASPSTAVARLMPDELEAPPLTLRQLTWRRFRRHKMALLGAVVLILLFFYSFGGALVVGEDYANSTSTALRLQPPSRQHAFGTDTVGRDILARTIYGGQISLLIGLTAMAVEVVAGVLIGAAAGYYGGIVDSILMRITEAVFVVPQIFLLLVMARYFGNKLPDVSLFGRTLSGSVVVVVLIIGLTSWMYLARIVRAEFMSLKEREYVLAARATGTPAYQIIFGHILPNTMAPIIVSATLSIATAILAEAYISFLGLGVQPPTATWGNMLTKSQENFTLGPHLVIFPGLLITITVLCLYVVGDGLRDALDPTMRGR